MDCGTLLEEGASAGMPQSLMESEVRPSWYGDETPTHLAGAGLYAA